jgi:hypothetical protein
MYTTISNLIKIRHVVLEMEYVDSETEKTYPLYVHFFSSYNVKFKTVSRIYAWLDNRNIDTLKKVKVGNITEQTLSLRPVLMLSPISFPVF